MPCKEYTSGLLLRIIDQKNLKPQDRELFLYSGRWVNEMGNYESCKKQANMSYYNLQFGIDVIREAIGVCFSDLCTYDDWMWMQRAVQDRIQKIVSQPNSSYYIARYYMVVDFKKVHPVDGSIAALKDPLVAIFGVIVLLPIGLTAFATLRSFIKRKSIHLTSYQLLHDSRDAFDCIKQSTFKMPILEAFNLTRHLLEAKNYSVLTANQLAVDIIRIVYCIFIFAYEVPFVHAEVSKIAADAKENAYYNTGPADSNLQIVLFLPTGLLTIGGYVSIQSILRAYKRQQLIGSRLKDAWWKFCLCNAALSVRRYLRFAFGFFVSAVFVWKILPLILAGPMRFTDLGCFDGNFWPSLLLQSNSFAGNGKRMCGMWMWYFAIDFRLFLLAALIATCHVYSRRAAQGIGAILMVSSITASIWYNQKNGIREVHPYTGRWITDVMTSPYYSASSYFFGVLLGLKLPTRCKITSIDEAAEKSIDIREEDDTEQSDRRREGSKRKFFWIVVGSISLAVLSLTLSIFYCMFQNDAVDIQDWPQWRHTIFNTAGVFVIAVFPVAVVAAACHLFEPQLMHLLKRSLLFGFMRSIYFEMMVVGIPLLLTLLFALENVPFFDPYLVNNSISWEILLALIIAAAVHFTVTKPIDIVVNKIIKL